MRKRFHGMEEMTEILLNVMVLPLDKTLKKMCPW
jgi:hypothetical protein